MTKYITNIRQLAVLLAIIGGMCSCDDFYEFEPGDAVPAAEMTLVRHEIDIMQGERYAIPALFTPDTLSNNAIYWESDNKEIAAFKNDTLEAREVGTTLVRAISVSSQIEDSCVVNVIPRWEGVSPSTYPYDMVIYADVTVHGKKPDDTMTIAAFCGREIRGVGELQEAFGVSYMVLRIWSPFVYGDQIRIGCYHHGQALIEYFPDEFTFDGESHGTLSNQIKLTLGEEEEETEQ